MGLFEFIKTIFIFFIILIIVLIYRKEIYSLLIILYSYTFSFFAGIFNISTNYYKELLFFLGLVLFGVILIKVKDGLMGFENFTNKYNYIQVLNNDDKNDLFESEHFNTYLASIHPDIYSVKVNTLKSSFINEYKNMIAIIPDEYLESLDSEVKIADDLIDKSDLKILKDIKWNILVSRKGLEMDMPFTLDKFILIPIDTLQFYYAKYSVKNKKKLLDNKKNNFYNAFTKTLIHEKIHLLQRKYQDKFNQFYTDNYKFAKPYNKTSANIPEQLKKICMTNPDSNFDVWTYTYNSNKYIPILTVSNGVLTELGFNENNYNDTIELKKVSIDDDILQPFYSQYHPNEIFACELTEQIANDYIKDNYKEFLLSLEK